MDELKAAVAEFLAVCNGPDGTRLMSVDPDFLSALLTTANAAVAFIEREEEKRVGLDIKAEHV
jgi:hypothetical protein